MNDKKKSRWNRSSVVAEAGNLVDREGVEALTLTRLAEVLGIRPPSLFNHVDSLSGLVRNLAVDALGLLADRIEASLQPPHTPAEGLGAMMDAYRSFVREHPGRYGTTLIVPAAIASQDEAFARVEQRILSTGIHLAGEFGLTGEDAVHALRGWRALAHGFSTLERSQGFGLPLDCDESFRRAVMALTPATRRGRLGETD